MMSSWSAELRIHIVYICMVSTFNTCPKYLLSFYHFQSVVLRSGQEAQTSSEMRGKMRGSVYLQGFFYATPTYTLCKRAQFHTHG